MAYEAEAIIEAYWGALEDIPDDAIPAGHLLRLLAGICERLHQVEPSETLWDTAIESRESAELNDQARTGDQVQLAYVYSALGDGFVSLETFNAEVAEDGESGTVVGAPGTKIRFDEPEARRAIQILAALFPGAS